MISDFVEDPQSPRPIVLVLSGDLVLDVPDADHWLAGIAPALRAADLAIGHLEVPHTRRGTELAGDVPAPGADPDELAALPRAGFAAVTLAGNHIADCGAQGILDTRQELARLGIAATGAGLNLAQASEPALLTRRGRNIGLLSYNCVGPEAAWATARRAGCAYLEMATRDGAPVTPTAALSHPTQAALSLLVRDIGRLRRTAQLIVVALHKGIVHTPSVLAPYERPVAQAAIDAGADIVVSHHAHILRGIEWHKGRPIFHGLGNGCVVTHALSPAQSHPARAEWARRRKQLFGFEPDPAYSLAPFHPEAVNAMLARVLWHADGRIEAGVVPVHVEPPGRPVLADAQQSERIGTYIKHITAAAGLPPITLLPRADMLVLQ